MAKTTNREYFEQIATIVADNEELTAFVQKQIAALDAKSSKANEKKEKETAGRVEAVYNELVRIGKPITVKDFLGETALDTTEFSKERVTALLRKLVLANRVTATKSGKVTIYATV